MTRPGRTMWLHPWATGPTCMPCQAFPLRNPCSQARPASSLNLEKAEKEVRAGDAGRAALGTHSPLLFLSGLKGAGEPAGGRRRDHLGPVRAPCSPPFLSFSPTTAPRKVGRRMLELGHTPGSWAEVGIHCDPFGRAGILSTPSSLPVCVFNLGSVVCCGFSFWISHLIFGMTGWGGWFESGKANRWGFKPDGTHCDLKGQG